MPISVPSFILIHPTVWPQYTIDSQVCHLQCGHQEQLVDYSDLSCLCLISMSIRNLSLRVRNMRMGAYGRVKDLLAHGSETKHVTAEGESITREFGGVCCLYRNFKKY